MWFDASKIRLPRPANLANSANTALENAESLLPISRISEISKPGRFANSKIPRSLEIAAIALCDSYRYSPSQRAQMLADLDSFSPESWAWLEQYFIETSVRMDMERINALELVTCAGCAHATVEAGIARCKAGVDSGLPIRGYWATDRHLCHRYQNTDVPA
jgi:hypothetical protein